MNNVEFLLEDILRTMPQSATASHGLISVLNHHLVSKKGIRNIFIRETKKRKPDWRILSGALRTFVEFLAYMPRIAFYEVIDVADALKYCYLNDKHKTVRELSADAITRLFLTLYMEYFLVPRNKNLDIIKSFKNKFTKEDLVKTLETYPGLLSSFVFQQYGLRECYGNERKAKILEFIDEFYQQVAEKF